MMLAIAFESVIKLLAMLAVGVFAYLWLSNRTDAVVESVHTLFTGLPPVGFISQTLLSFLAIICLPRQFHVAVVECGDVRDVRRARWMFGGYLVLISGMVLPIATAGVTLFGTGGSVADDSMVLALPLAEGRNALALIAYVGGFSAATGMVIVSSIALATMVSNDLVMPVLLRRSGDHQEAADVASRVLWIRRLAILLLALMAYSYYRTSSNDSTLASYGLMAFAAVAQFAPGLIGGLYWRGASRRGVEVGMLLGFATWLYTLLLPAMTMAGWVDAASGAARPVRHRVAASAAAVRHVRLGSADPRHVLVAAGQCGHDDAGVRTLAARRRRAPACGTVPRPVCRAPVGGRRLARPRACGRPAGAGLARGRRAPCAAFVLRAGAVTGP